MKSLKQIAGIYLPTAYFFIFNLAMLTLFRVGFGLWQWERMAAEPGYWLGLLVGGLRIDVLLLCWVSLGAVILTFVFALFPKTFSIWKKTLRGIFVGLTLIFIFMELSTPAFVQTYDVRPNRIFVEYLIYPREVFGMLLDGHFASLCVVAIALVAAAFGVWKLSAFAFPRGAESFPKLSLPQHGARAALTVFVVVLCIFGGRGRLGFKHHPINPTYVVFANDNLLNKLALNSTYSVLNAVNMMTNERNAAKIYGKMPPEEILRIVREARGRPASDYISEKFPTLTRNTASVVIPAGKKPRNVVIILQESLGARYIGCLGGQDLSPCFDKLSKEGWNFENLYCTGTRSVRGIEAVTTGFTSTAAQAVVKQPKAQSGFFTLADFFGAHGYKTQFVYGGYATFDNMINFCLGNGYQEIVDRGDFSPEELTVPEERWGVSDVDSLARLHRELEKNHAAGKPFYTLYFSISNHDPFIVPERPGLVYKDAGHTRNNSAQYADYAIGQFFELAKKSSYWNDTVFLVVADHDSRVTGPTLMPVDHFHIPALIIAPGVAPRSDTRLVSQIDLPPTLISLAGVSGDYPMTGYDLTRAENPDRATMQFFENFAYMKKLENGRASVVVLANGKEHAGTYDFTTKKLTLADTPPAKPDAALARASVLLGSYLYDNELYPSVARAAAETETPAPATK